MTSGLNGIQRFVSTNFFYTFEIRGGFSKSLAPKKFVILTTFVFADTEGEGYNMDHSSSCHSDSFGARSHYFTCLRY